jgi:hypothetical protein
MSVECLHAAQQLTVVSAIDQALAVALDGFSQQCKRTLVEDFFVRYSASGWFGFYHFKIKL